MIDAVAKQQKQSSIHSGDAGYPFSSSTSAPRAPHDSRKRTRKQDPGSATQGVAMLLCRDPLGTALPLCILVLDSFLVLLIGRPWVLVRVEHALLDELIRRGAVGNLVVQRVGPHVLLELCCPGNKGVSDHVQVSGFTSVCAARGGYPRGRERTSFCFSTSAGAAVVAGRMFSRQQHTCSQLR